LDFLKTSLPGVLIVKPQVHEDARGFFVETFRADRFASAGILDTFVQDNHSFSVRGTLRGLHYQLRHAQAKLCRVVLGEVLDVALDVRRGSPTFGLWTSCVLSAENKLQLYVPRGFAHGYAVLSETAHFLYKCDNYYDPADERGILWNDRQLGIDWQVVEPVLSERDRRHPPLRQADARDLPEYTA
jgi:dTDP-4-dehydrorhamnose 3,5-epimerase